MSSHSSHSPEVSSLSALIRPDHAFYYLLCLLAGLLTPLAFAPFDQVWLVLITLPVLLYGVLQSEPLRALKLGWLFGLGLQCSGVSWIYYSLHFHGGSPVWLAVLMIFLLSSYLAIYPALAFYLVNRFVKGTPVMRLLVLYPLSWALFEWLQGWVMTGFSWMQIGYSQIDWPLAGYAPLLGSLGVGWLVFVSAGAIVLAVTRLMKWPAALFIMFVIWLAGGLLGQISWTEATGDPVRVSLVQGNIPQSDKWRREMRLPTLKRYRDLSLQQGDADLVIWPETAVPGYYMHMREYLDGVQASLAKTNTQLLTGLFISDEETGRYYNSLINVTGGEYRKRHLVPLGEYIPLRFLASFFNRWIDIPMSDIDSGDSKQALLTGAGQPLGVSICFEDAFARDVIRDLPEATLLVNVSNDAWFEDSHESYQHHAIARMRALESGRYMLRSTNTGISAIIGPHGEVVASSPQFEVHVLNADVQPLKGATPYVLWGDYLLLLISLLTLTGFAVRGRT